MMLAEPRSSGLWHETLTYRDTDEFESAACAFAEEGARAGAAVLVACTGPPLIRLRSRLNGLRDRVNWTDLALSWANPGRLISEISWFAEQNPGPVWCVQQAAWPDRPAETLWEVIRHEALINLALAGNPARVLCPYDEALAAGMLSCARATHPVIRQDGRSRPNPDFQRALPPECDRPLSEPPDGAQVMRYRRNLSDVRHLVSLRSHTAGLPPGRCGDLLIAIGELTANTLDHTTGSGTLTVWETSDEIICQVHDNGHITDPLVGRLRPDPGAETRGRGLWLVHQLCDLVQTRTGPAGTTTRVHMRLPRLAARPGRSAITGRVRP